MTHPNFFHPRLWLSGSNNQFRNYKSESLAKHFDQLEQVSQVLFVYWMFLFVKMQSVARKFRIPKGQLNSEWIYEVIVSPKKPTKNYKDFCPTKQTRIVVLFFGDFLVIVGSFFGYAPCLFGKAEIFVIIGWHFGRNDDLINSFGI